MGHLDRARNSEGANREARGAERHRVREHTDAVGGIAFTISRRISRREHAAAKDGSCASIRWRRTVPELPRPWIERGGGKLGALSTHAATLEDLFVHLTGRELRDA